MSGNDFGDMEPIKRVQLGMASKAGSVIIHVRVPAEFAGRVAYIVVPSSDVTK